MHWIIQNNMFSESGHQELIDTLNRFNIPYSEHKVVPFVGELMPDINPEGNVICMGSYSMRHIAARRGWYPGVFDIEDQTFEVQRHHWGDMMLNADSIVTRFADAKIDGEAFMRPIEDSKVFAGRVFTSEELETWQHSILQLNEDDGSSMDGNTLVQVCKTKKIYAEYRFWIVDQEIVTASLYKRGDRVVYSSQVDKHVYDFANQVLRSHDGGVDIRAISGNSFGWAPHEAFVLDVCETPDGMKVVEINTLNAAGYYAANMTDLVLALEGAFNKRTPK